jgi:N-acetylneuraminic acid mutarotase
MRTIYLVPLFFVACSASGPGNDDMAEAPDLAVPSFAPASSPTKRFAAASAVAPDGTIYVISGVTASSVLKSVDAYSPATNSWTALPPLSHGRNAAAAAVASDGRVFVFGGRDLQRNAVAAVEMYTPGASDWSTVAQLPTPRSGLGAARGGDGRIYVVGGATDSTAQQYSEVVEAYDPTGDTWTTVAPLSEVRYALGVAAGSDGRIYAVGGIGVAPQAHLITAEVYDPAQDRWSPIARLSLPRSAHGLAVGRDGRLFAIAGMMLQPQSSATVTDTVEAYDPMGDRWEPIASLPFASQALVAHGAPDGRIYVFGGGDAQRNIFDLGAAYSPATNGWVADR